MIIGILGEKLAGKDTVAHYLIDKYGATHIKASDILDELLNTLGLPLTRRNEIDAGIAMEKMFGQTVIGDAIIKRVQKAETDFVVINGLRLQNQFEDAKKIGAKIIYVTAPIRLRFERSLKRVGENKDGQPSLEKFAEQDKEWTEIRIPEFGTQADFIIHNTGTLEELHQEIERIVHLLKN